MTTIATVIRTPTVIQESPNKMWFSIFGNLVVLDYWAMVQSSGWVVILGAITVANVFAFKWHHTITTRGKS